VTRVLAARGIDAAQADRFLEPSLRHLHHPSLMPDLDRAAARLLDAARQGEPIVIYGDYDVDGVTATAILFHTLRAIAPGAAVGTYVPHRLDEGYGLNSDAIREIASRGAKVIVSVDCGVTAVQPALVAAELGVDLIITDHHTPPARLEDMPRAFAVVHPRRPDSQYPFGELCGAGVAFKLAWRLATLACGSERVTDDLRQLLMELLGLTSLGVIADVVPLVDENRVIARFGLARIKYSAIEGLRALVTASGLDGEKILAEDVGFKLGPRLNACGRMGHAREAVELLTVARGERAMEIAANLTRQNDERRRIEREIFEQACAKAEAAGMTAPDRRAIVLADPRWHPGVVGIVCSRLVERYHRPAILMRDHDGSCHGSGRSVDGFSLHGALSRCAEHLAQFGGHDMAAGLRVDAAKLDAFTQAFVDVANSQIAPDKLTGVVGFDCAARMHEVNIESVRRLECLAPFGRDNPEVRVLVRNVRVASRAETFGTNNAHLSLRVADGEHGAAGGVTRMVAWKWGPRAMQFPPGTALDAVISPKVSTYSGRVEPEVIDVRPAL